MNFRNLFSSYMKVVIRFDGDGIAIVPVLILLIHEYGWYNGKNKKCCRIPSGCSGRKAAGPPNGCSRPKERQTDGHAMRSHHRSLKVAGPGQGQTDRHDMQNGVGCLFSGLWKYRREGGEGEEEREGVRETEREGRD